MDQHLPSQELGAIAPIVTTLLDGNVSSDDLSKVSSLFKGISNQVSAVTDFIQSILKKVENGESKTSKGISFLDVKYQLLLSYVIDLTHLMLMKSEGKKLEGDKTIERLVETRTVLEKMRPVDMKIRYQVDKLIKTATSGEIAPNDPRRFKPNPDNLVSKLQQEDSEEEGDDEDDAEDKGPQKYVPPKVSAMHFDGDLTVQEKKDRLIEKAKRRALSSSLIRELRDQYNEEPEEIAERGTAPTRKFHEAAKHQQEFEEGNFIRLPVTRKQKNLKRKGETMTGLEELTKFDNISALVDDSKGEERDTPAKKKSKVSSRVS
ncbi:putative neuroguidin isoform X2 [Apostichopus japonicus]|uniref:Putative neuroguidin isoform X2 n=1 Tax=Stichopus japonicus TaxID=307972 RepID=A0A2G8LCV1_STIJA|nr:putative neuroguidin isoform X2 [Apostichopus japonicus]